MNELSKEEADEIKRLAQEMSQAITAAMLSVSRDKRAAIVASTKVAAGMCRAANMDLHRAIHLFMTFYKDADEHFTKAGH